jgi:hypothetical protein
MLNPIFTDRYAHFKPERMISITHNRSSSPMGKKCENPTGAPKHQQITKLEKEAIR